MDVLKLLLEKWRNGEIKLDDDCGTQNTGLMTADK